MLKYDYGSAPASYGAVQKGTGERVQMRGMDMREASSLRPLVYRESITRALNED